jgi:hypothetical protein
MNVPAAHRPDPTAIKGWGVDADPSNDPTYPYRDRSHDDGPGMTWQRPAQQEPEVEILASIEHNRLPAVLGTSTPPRGLSGVIRRAAFKYSESNWWHWLMLMGADRIDVVEGVARDLTRLKVPNIPAEMGIKAELRHNKKGFATKVGIAAALTVVLFGLSQSSKKKNRERDG